MTVQQQRAIEQLRFELIAECTDRRNLIVKGTRLYYLSPGGLLRPVEPTLMAEKPWAEKTLEERYNHAPGQFGAVVDAFAIPGEPELSMLVRRVCRHMTIWPEQLLGYGLAHSYGAAEPRSVPLSTGRCDGPIQANYVVAGRRLIWRGAYELTDLSIESIAALFGYSPSTVRPWATSWKRFEAEDPTWWRFWGPARADLIGVPLGEPYSPADEAEAILRGAAT